MDRTMLYFSGIMMLVFAAVSFLQNMLPEPYAQQLGGIAFLVGTILGIGGLEAYYILRTSSYPYIQLLVRPENEVVECFIDVPQSRKRRIMGNLWSTTLTLAFPRKIKAYGDTQINQIRLTHEYEYENRIQYRPGRASLDDYDFNHPQTECIEVMQIPRKATSLDRAEVIPEFRLLSARNDYRLKVPGLDSPGRNASYRVMDPDALDNVRELEEQVEKLVKDKEELLVNLAQERNDSHFWHQQAISFEQHLDLKSVETSGLLDQKGGIKDFSIEYVLTHLVALGTFQKVKEQLMGSKWQRWGKEMFGAVVLCFFIAYLWMNPSTLDGVYNWAMANQLVIVLLLAVIGMLAIYGYTRRKY